MENVSETRSFDEMMDALTDVKRRRLLVTLLERRSQDPVPAIGTDCEGDPDTVERALSMHHIHLPKLANYGFISWDKDARGVTKGSNFDEIRPLLELLDDHEDVLPTDWL